MNSLFSALFLTPMYNRVMDNQPTETNPTNNASDLFAPVQKEEAVELFLFELDSELYAVSVGDVDQIMKIPPVTSIPNAPESILGIFHLRGKVIVVIDMLKRMRINRISPFLPLYLFISHQQKNYFAVVLDKVFSVIKVPKSQIMPLTPVIASKINSAYVNGMFMHHELPKEQKRSDNFLIEPKNTETTEPTAQLITRPVLWLNVATLLNQEDVLQMQKEI